MNKKFIYPWIIILIASSSCFAQNNNNRIENEILSLKRDLEIEKKITNNRIEMQDKRISDISLGISQQSNNLTSSTSLLSIAISILGTIVTLILFLAGYATYLVSTKKSIEAAREESKNWIKSNSTNIEKQIKTLEKTVSDAMKEIDRLNNDLSNKHKQAHNKIDESVQEMLRSFHQKAMPNDTEAMQSDSSSTAANDVKAASNELSSKAEDQFTPQDHFIRGLNEQQENRLDSALISYEKAINHPDFPKIEPEQQLRIYFAKSIAMEQIGKIDDAISIYNKIEDNYIKNDSLAYYVSMSIFNKGLLYHRQQKINDAISTYQFIEDNFAHHNKLEIQEQVAMSLVNLAYDQQSLGFTNEAELNLNKLLHRYSNSNAPTLSHQVTLAYANLLKILNTEARKEDAESILDKFKKHIAKLEDSSSDTIHYIKSKFNYAILLKSINQATEASVHLNDIQKSYQHSNDPEAVNIVVLSMLSLFQSFENEGDANNARETIEKIISIYRESKTPNVQRSVIVAMRQLAAYLINDGDSEAALSLLMEIIDRGEKVGMSEAPGFLQDTKLAYARCLISLNRNDDASKILKTLINEENMNNANESFADLAKTAEELYQSINRNNNNN